MAAQHGRCGGLCRQRRRDRLLERPPARIFRFTGAEALGQSLDIIIPVNLRERHWEGFRTTMRAGQSRSGAGDLLSVAAIRKDGTGISVEFTNVPFRTVEGTMEGTAAVMRDVTARFNGLRTLRRQLQERSRDAGPSGAVPRR